MNACGRTSNSPLHRIGFSSYGEPRQSSTVPPAEGREARGVAQTRRLVERAQLGGLSSPHFAAVVYRLWSLARAVRVHHDSTALQGGLAVTGSRMVSRTSADVVDGQRTARPSAQMGGCLRAAAMGAALCAAEQEPPGDCNHVDAAQQSAMVARSRSLPLALPSRTKRDVVGRRWRVTRQRPTRDDTTVTGTARTLDAISRHRRPATPTAIALEALHPVRYQ
jgi:hypothetical protein